MLGLNLQDRKTKKMFYATVTMIIIVSSLSLTYGAVLSTFEVTNNLTVPTQPTSYEVYQEDGVTQISLGDDISDLWDWDWTKQNFQVIIKVKNTGGQSILTDVRTGDIPNWSLVVVGEGTITASQTQTLNITLSPTITPTVGMTTGQFSLYIDVSEV